MGDRLQKRNQSIIPKMDLRIIVVVGGSVTSEMHFVATVWQHFHARVLPFANLKKPTQHIIHLAQGETASL